MRLHRRFLGSAAGFCLRPSVWGTVLTLAVVVVSSLTFARLVVTPAIFGSDRLAPSSPSKSEPTHGKPLGASAKKAEVVDSRSGEPPVEISLAVDKPTHRRR